MLLVKSKLFKPLLFTHDTVAWISLYVPTDLAEPNVRQIFVKLTIYSTQMEDV